jgi:hypothetical protein
MTTAPSHAVQATAGERTKVPLVLGLDTFGDVTHDDDDRPLSHAQTIRNIVEAGVLADQVGVEVFGIGEHHTKEVPLSAGDVVLGAIAARTTRIHLGSAVTVLSSDDPVRVFQRYSTLNAICGGRAAVSGRVLALRATGAQQPHQPIGRSGLVDAGAGWRELVQSAAEVVNESHYRTVGGAKQGHARRA